ncbi:MAG: DNA-processing protein DprA [Proteobacteria bacterium]|jgi:DNA processing protein|nr:DNA-processing protein DprA [Pseudomonadota bacterium]MDA1299721.1 DNA-processing protein DprA [Pseudomonadota bacterium]
MPDHDLLLLHRLLARQPGRLLPLLRRFESASAVIDLGARGQLSDDDSGLNPDRNPGPGTRLSQDDFSRCRSEGSALLRRDLAWLQQDGHHLLTYCDPEYPRSLKEIPDPPALLFAAGDLAALDQPRLSMVGSRTPTRLGLRTAHRMAADLADQGFAVVSGLALGIDAASHQGALDAAGSTIAVLGTGCDRCYPARHRPLAEQIVKSGLLLSEFPLGTTPNAWHFPHRNRIVTGLSRGTIVVEARLPSGSLISARLALEQGREVFAVPGPVTSTTSHGCHQLIRDGATLVESAADVLAEFEVYIHSHPIGEVSPPASLNQHQETLFGLIDSQPQTVDELVAGCGLSAEVVLGALVELEIMGLICGEKGGYSRASAS